MLKPAYKLTFKPPAYNGGGGLLGAANSLASSVGLGSGSGGKAVDTTAEPQASTVVDLTVSLDMDTPADSVMLVMGQVGTFRPERDGVLTVELGYEDTDEMIQVITGTIVYIEPGLTTRRVVAHNAAHELMRAFAEQTYENKSAGDILRDLAGQANIEVETADDGITFPAYVIDGQRGIYHHLLKLAELCGFDLYVNSEGKLIFQRFAGGRTVHVFNYGTHILEMDVSHTTPLAGEVIAWGESPGGRKSQEDWAWLTKDFGGLKGSAGTGSPSLLLEKPVLRSRQAALTAARASQTQLTRRTLRGRMVVLGHPKVKLGDAIRLQDVPEDDLNAIYQVRGITHRITKKSGFTTTIDFRSKE